MFVALLPAKYNKIVAVLLSFTIGKNVNNSITIDVTEKCIISALLNYVIRVEEIETRVLVHFRLFKLILGKNSKSCITGFYLAY